MHMMVSTTSKNVLNFVPVIDRNRGLSTNLVTSRSYYRNTRASLLEELAAFEVRFLTLYTRTILFFSRFFAKKDTCLSFFTFKMINTAKKKIDI
eukprot:SAG11_NODE_110_length_16199_cov_18.081180_3_plen_94_part_00